MEKGRQFYNRDYSFVQTKCQQNGSKPVYDAPITRADFKPQ